MGQGKIIKACKAFVSVYVLLYVSTVISAVFVPKCSTKLLVNMAMVNLKVICTLTYWMIFITLCVVSVFLTKEVIKKYLSFDSSFKTSEDSLTELPSVVICFMPSNDSYSYDEHFAIYQGSFLDLFVSDREHYKLKLGDNPNFKIHFSELLTTYSGLCYKVTSTASKVGKNDWHLLSVIFVQDTPQEMLPVIVVHFTSEMNSFGISRTYWLDGDVAILHVKPQHRLVEFGLREERRSFLTEKSKCRDEPFYHCYGSELLKHNFSQCPKKCLSHSVPEDVQSKYQVPLCEIDSKDMLCGKNVSLNVRRVVVDSGICIDKACNPREYKGVITHEDIVGEPIHSRTFAYYFLPPVQVKNYEEFTILDFFELLGSIGGTLGMLIGFSFLGLASFILKNLQLLTRYLSNALMMIKVGQCFANNAFINKSSFNLIFRKRFFGVQIQMLFVGCKTK